ncbi:hypothetical protein [Microcystis viridis]|uniref:hypothetical protein n=1 Tax=Microcystis viridis TaxID=44822 RepID=UPI000F78BBC3|nr:hypothetical protein [Microcystis viridis]
MREAQKMSFSVALPVPAYEDLVTTTGQPLMHMAFAEITPGVSPAPPPYEHVIAAHRIHLGGVQSVSVTDTNNRLSTFMAGSRLTFRREVTTSIRHRVDRLEKRKKVLNVIAH